MLTLYSSPASPFVRKVQIAAALLGLGGRLKVVETDTANPETAFQKANPLGKIPALGLEDGGALYDSRVIVEYLDHLAGGGILFPAGPERFTALRQQALADGLADAAVLVIYEKRFRAADNYDEGWVARQNGKVARSLVELEREFSTPAPKLHIGHIAQACALGYLDLRFNGAWRASHPQLAAWHKDFIARVPAYAATAA